MPSLQQELADKLKNLKFDDGEDEPTTNNPQPEMNMTHKVFHYFRLNPMSTVAECTEATGVPAARASALVIQLLNRKLLSRTKRGQESYRYTALQDSIPDPTDARKAALIKAHAMRKANAAERRKHPKAKVVPKTKKAKEEAPTPGFNAAMLVGGLTPFQAKAVYDELHKLFGG